MTPVGPLALLPPPSSSQQEPCRLDCRAFPFPLQPSASLPPGPEGLWLASNRQRGHTWKSHLLPGASLPLLRPSHPPSTFCFSRVWAPESGLKWSQLAGELGDPHSGEGEGRVLGVGSGARMGVQAGGGRDQAHLAPSSTQSDMLLPIAKHKVPRCLGAVAASPLPGPRAQSPRSLWEAG